jgi:hypothetical protein
MLQLPLYHKCHVLSESQIVKVGFITAWLDEANQHKMEGLHYALYVLLCYAVRYHLAPDCARGGHAKPVVW